MKKLLLTTIIAAFFGTANAQNCVDQWAYAVPININNISNPDTLFDFQVILDVPTDVLISNSKMQANGEDIRFTNGDCCTQLCYNVEKGINTANTTIAVNIPMIPAGDSITIFMHYGNPNATAGDDPDCVYLFWDDFNDNVFDSVKWEIRDGFDTLIESNGILTMVGTQSWDYIKSNVNFKSDTILLRDRWTSYIGGGASGTCYSFPGNDNRYTYRHSSGNMWTVNDNNLDFSNSGYLNGVPALPHPHNTNQFYEYEMVTTLTGNNIHYVSGKELTTSTTDNTSVPFTLYSDTAYKVGYSGHGTTAGGMRLDYVFVTQYNSHAPAYTMGAEQNVNGGSIATNDTAFCAGDSVDLDAGSGWISYLWSTTDTVQVITVNTAGAYTVSRPNSLGCDVIDTITVTENPLPDASFSSTNTSLDYDFTNSANNGSTWAWDFGDGDTAQTQNPSHSYSTPGTYTVCLTVTDTNGCVATECDTITAAFPVAINTATSVTSIQVYPNPTTGMLVLSKKGNVTVLNLTGSILLQEYQMNTIDISSLADGVYFISVETEEGTFMQKVLLER